MHLNGKQNSWNSLEMLRCKYEKIYIVVDFKIKMEKHLFYMIAIILVMSFISYMVIHNSCTIGVNESSDACIPLSYTSFIISVMILSAVIMGALIEKSSNQKKKTRKKSKNVVKSRKRYAMKSLAFVFVIGIILVSIQYFIIIPESVRIENTPIEEMDVEKKIEILTRNEQASLLYNVALLLSTILSSMAIGWLIKTSQ